MVVPAAHICGAVLGIGQRQEIGLEQPDDMGRGDDKRDDQREPWPGRCQSAARVAVEQQEQRVGRRQDDDEIFRPQRAAEGKAEQEPMAEAAALERRVESVAGQRPERQLDDVVIELHRRVLEVMHAVDDQHGNERAGRSDQRPCRRPHRDEGDDHRRLRQRVIGGVGAERPVHDLNQPPRQRRQLVVAELPLAAIGQRFDQVERQVGVEQGRQRGPDREMQSEERGERRPRRRLDPVDEAGPNAKRGAGVFSGICGIADMSFRAGSKGGVCRRALLQFLPAVIKAQQKLSHGGKRTCSAAALVDTATARMQIIAGGAGVCAPGLHRSARGIAGFVWCVSAPSSSPSAWCSSPARSALWSICASA